MAISFVKNVGGNTASNSKTVAVTVPAAGVALGDLLVVRAGQDSNDASQSLTSIADTKLNTYAELVAPVTFGSNRWAYIWYASVGTALVSGNTITVTFLNKGNIHCVIDQFSGLTTTKDGTNSASGSSTTPSTNITPTQAADLVVSHLMILSGEADSFTEDTDSDAGDTWHGLTTQTGTGGVNISRGAYKITISAATDTYNPSLGTSRAWAVLLAGIQGTDQPSTETIPYLVAARR